MAKAKKTAKTTKAPKAALRASKKIEETYPHGAPEPGSIVWVRWSVSEYKIAVLVRYSNADKPVCRIARVDRNGRYTGESFGTERAFELGEVSRVFHERDWESIGKGESVADIDARMARGPKVGARGNVRDDQPKIGGRNVIDIDDIDAAYDVAQSILDDRAISAGTLRNLARWTLRSNDLLEEWKAKCDRLEATNDNDDVDAIASKTDETEPNVDDEPIVDKGDIVSIKYGKDWEPAVVAFIDAQEMIFDTIDGNSGSRDVAERGKSWVLAPDNKPGLHRGDKVANMASAAFEDHRIEHEARKRKGTAAKMPSTNKMPADTSVDEIAPHIRGNAYCMQTCGPECRLYQGPEFRDPPIGDGAPVINVRVGRKWEGVRVDRLTSEIIGFVGDDGTRGTRPWSTLGKDWNHAALGSWAPKSDIKIRIALVEQTMKIGHDPVLVELHRQLMLEAAIDVEDTAKGAERERKRVAKQGEKALRKATGTKALSPVDRAVASSKCGARGPDGIVCIIDAGHGAATPVGVPIQHSNGPRTWTEALPKMVVTSERVGPPIEQPFIDDKPEPGSMSIQPIELKVGGRWVDAMIVGNDADKMMVSHGRGDQNQTVMVLLSDEGKLWRRPAPATPEANDGLTLHQRNMAEAKRRGVPVWQVVEEQEKKRGEQLIAEATASVRSAAERDANEVADDDELSVASDRELEALGKQRAPDGSIVDAWPTPDGVKEAAASASMPWETTDDIATTEGRMPWD